MKNQHVTETERIMTDPLRDGNDLPEHARKLAAKLDAMTAAFAKIKNNLLGIDCDGDPGLVRILDRVEEICDEAMGGRTE